ncbi:hypothetical protein ABFS83_13G105100 [Erythranthe nasuta]
MMDSSSAASVPNNNKVMEKTDPPPPPPPPQQQQLPPPPHLKCPRCDSANTKFCYYNNYSLSQPRHFCKACKRYWTRGGTLRNVPVGGGCRKNKKLRRPSSSAGGGGITTSASKHSSAHHQQQQQIDLSSSSRPHASNYMMSNNNNNNSNTSSFYPIELNFPFSSYSTNSAARVSSDNNNTGIFDLQQSHESSLGILGFSSGLNMAAAIDEDYKNGFSRQLIQSSSTTAGNNNYNSILFGSSSSTMASLLASTLQHQKFGITDSSPPPINYDNEDNTQLSINRWSQNNNINPNINNEQMMINNINSSSSDHHQHHQQPAASSSSPLVWNTSNVGSWFDPSSMAASSSSVPSLI